MNRHRKKSQREPSATYLREVASMATDLKGLGLSPVLVGGMALVILGSRRVTRDFDFLIKQPASREDALTKIFYRRGFELASRLDAHGEILETIDNSRVASARLKIDDPSSIYFLNPKTGLRIDLLFDFPLPAQMLFERASIVRVASHSLHIAAKVDLIELKKIALTKRQSAADAQDLEFLKSLP